MDADLTVVGPEAPLAEGVVDRVPRARPGDRRSNGRAARLEASKAFAKEFMLRANIPTARFATVTSAREAQDALRQFDFPVVLKADGLAAGKGVIIAISASEAHPSDSSTSCRLARAWSSKSSSTGEEVSFIVLSDGVNIVPLEPSQDHKAVHDGDSGPNTGGMGAYCDGRILDEFHKSQILAQIIRPAIERMRAEGQPFTGFLYAGSDDDGARAQGARVQLHVWAIRRHKC